MSYYHYPTMYFHCTHSDNDKVIVVDLPPIWWSWCSWGILNCSRTLKIRADHLCIYDNWRLRILRSHDDMITPWHNLKAHETIIEILRSTLVIVLGPIFSASIKTCQMNHLTFIQCIDPSKNSTYDVTTIGTWEDWTHLDMWQLVIMLLYIYIVQLLIMTQCW